MKMQYHPTTGTLKETTQATSLGSVYSDVKYRYDKLDRMVLTVVPGISVSGASYDGDGNVTQGILYALTDWTTADSLPSTANAEITTTKFDGLDRAIEVDDPIYTPLAAGTE